MKPSPFRCLRGTTCGRLVVLVIVAGVVWLGAPRPVSATASSDDPAGISLQVHPADDGGVRAAGVVHIAAPPAIVHAVLTDYARWPELFETPLSVTRIDRVGDRVLTDLSMRHPLLFGENQLRCENVELPEGGLITRMLEGDFRAYTRTWRLVADEDGVGTRAHFELHLVAESWAPDWLLAIVVEQGLEEHFRLLKKRAERQDGTLAQ